MLLTFLYPDEKSPDDRSGKTFAGLRQGDDEPGAGGLHLALRCTSWETWYSIKALKIGGNPLWDFYSQTVKEVKTPQHGLARTRSMVHGQWRFDRQLVMFVKTLQDIDQLSEVLQYHETSFIHLKDKAGEAL
jgi:hypothetical protein